MLHCPRCLGPLHVREEEATPKAASSNPEQQPRLPPLPGTFPAAAGAASPAMATAPLCPSGHLCPYEQSIAAAAATSKASRSSVYMSGGGIVPASSSPEHPQESHHDRPSQQHQHQHQQLFRPAPPPPPRLDMLAMPQQHFALPQQQQQQQQQHFLCQPQPQVITTSVQPHFAVLGNAVTAVTAGQQFPLFLTSTIPGPSAPACSVSLSQPPTPAIVVGSTGNPFFPPPPRPASLQLQPVISHQQQQQQFAVSLCPQPASHGHAQPVQQPSPAAVKEILRVNRERLEECGWYYPALTWNESAELLRDAAPGTFLVRDSSDDRFLFSLSVQRSGKEGPTSVRIHFQRGKFKLDAEEDILHLMPEFPSVLDLIDHYLLPPMQAASAGSSSCSSSSSKEAAAVARAGALFPSSSRGKTPVWLDANGQQSSEIRLRQPLYQNVPSLAHAARLAVNRSLVEKEGRAGAVKTLGVPTKLEKYLVDYPNRV